jgi:hypothetical protein
MLIPALPPAIVQPPCIDNVLSPHSDGYDAEKSRDNVMSFAHLTRFSINLSSRWAKSKAALSLVFYRAHKTQLPFLSQSSHFRSSPLQPAQPAQPSLATQRLSVSVSQYLSISVSQYHPSSPRPIDCLLHLPIPLFEAVLRQRTTASPASSSATMATTATKNKTPAAGKPTADKKATEKATVYSIADLGGLVPVQLDLSLANCRNRKGWR